MSKKVLPLVSVPVITYNSAKTVIETLDSIKAQTYQNLELIVSDDCSTDNTVEVCQKWIEENKSRFVRTEVVTVEKNTGVAGNLNRAEAACRGEWIKPIAGDDVLLPNCIQDCIDYVAEHPETKRKKRIRNGIHGLIISYFRCHQKRYCITCCLSQMVFRLRLCFVNEI